MKETFGKRRPILPKLEPLFDAAYGVDEAVKMLRVQINAADAYCITLEEANNNNRPNFIGAAVTEVDAAMLTLRNEISAAQAYCVALEKLTCELHIGNIFDDEFQPLRMLRSRRHEGVPIEDQAEPVAIEVNLSNLNEPAPPDKAPVVRKG